MHSAPSTTRREVGRREEAGGLEVVARPALALALAVGLAASGSSGASAQSSDGADLRIGGLLRTGVSFGPDDFGGNDGFEIFDARLKATGETGLFFDYFVQAEFEDDTDEFELLDARLGVPIRDELRVDVGQFKAPVGHELLTPKGEISFVERSQITELVAPGRQVGIQLSGELMEGQLGYRGGVFNGNGRELENDNDAFLYAGRVEYRSIAGAAFHDEFVVEVGANVAFSEDSAVSLGSDEPGSPFRFNQFRGDRLIFGGDARLAYRGGFLRGEYLRAEFDPDALVRVTIDGGAAVVAMDDVDGGYVEGGYTFFGFLEALVRYDALTNFVPDEDPREEVGGDFLVFGLNISPGPVTKVGFQYSVGVDGAEVGPGLVDDGFTLLAQVDF